MSGAVTVIQADRELLCALFALPSGNRQQVLDDTHGDNLSVLDKLDRIARHRTTSQAELVEALREFSTEYDGFQDGDGNPCPTLMRARALLAKISGEQS